MLDSDSCTSGCSYASLLSFFFKILLIDERAHNFLGSLVWYSSATARRCAWDTAATECSSAGGMWYYSLSQELLPKPQSTWDFCPFKLLLISFRCWRRPPRSFVLLFFDIVILAGRLLSPPSLATLGAIPALTTDVRFKRSLFTFFGFVFGYIIPFIRVDFSGSLLAHLLFRPDFSIAFVLLKFYFY